MTNMWARSGSAGIHGGVHQPGADRRDIKSAIFGKHWSEPSNHSRRPIQRSHLVQCYFPRSRSFEAPRRLTFLARPGIDVPALLGARD